MGRKEDLEFLSDEELEDYGYTEEDLEELDNEEEEVLIDWMNEKIKK